MIEGVIFVVAIEAIDKKDCFFPAVGEALFGISFLTFVG